MKIVTYYSFLYFFVSVLSSSAYGQDIKSKSKTLFPIQKDKLKTIVDPPVKIDGGCSFFGFSNNPVNARSPILIVSAHKEAIIKYNDTFIYFKRVARKETEKGYIDKYYNKNYWIILKINNIKKIEQNSSIRTGTMEILNKKGHIVFDVHGKVDEIDKYNSY